MKSVISAILMILSTSVLANTYTVQPGDSIWKISNQFSNGKVSTHKMIASIHEANSTVLGGNINNIRPGMVLDIPDAAAASQADSSVATRLLSGGHVSTNHQAQAQALILKIDKIKKQINQTVKDIEATRTAFENGSTK